MIQRTLGYSNKLMWDYCETLKNVVLQTKTEKSGRGKAIEINEVLKYRTDKKTIDNIVESCDYYKNLYEMESKGCITFRDYQSDIILKGSEILLKNRFLYLALEVRTGKTLTSLGIAERVKAQDVLFITKKKAISSILKDFELLKPSFSICVINYESLHTIDPDIHWDLIVCDEAHSCFTGDTLIDGKKIKDIDVGDYLNSFNFEMGIYENKKVINIYKNELAENLIKIKCNGKEIVCTESHKISTKRGWVRAGDILPEDELQIL